MYRIVIISFIVGLLTVSCESKRPAPNAGARLIKIFDEIPPSPQGWWILPQSWGSSGYEQTLCFTIMLEGASSGEAIQELKSSIEELVSKKGLNVITSGQAGDGEELQAFSFTVSDDSSVGTMVVNTAKISDDRLVAVVAIAQIGSEASK